MPRNQGQLRDRMELLRQLVLRSLSLVEALIDFGDEDVEEGDEASSMDVSGSMERPPRPQRTPRVHTPRPRRGGRHHQNTDVDELINNMGTLNIEQDATLQLAQQNAQLLQAMQDEETRRWNEWFQHYPPPQ